MIAAGREGKKPTSWPTGLRTQRMHRILRLPWARRIYDYRTQVPYVDGMENPGEAMRNAVRWLVKHGYTDTDIAKLAGGNALRVLKETWAR